MNLPPSRPNKILLSISFSSSHAHKLTLEHSHFSQNTSQESHHHLFSRARHISRKPSYCPVTMGTSWSRAIVSRHHGAEPTPHPLTSYLGPYLDRPYLTFSRPSLSHAPSQREAITWRPARRRSHHTSPAPANYNLHPRQDPSDSLSVPKRQPCPPTCPIRLPCATSAHFPIVWLTVTEVAHHDLMAELRPDALDRLRKH